jgi:Mg2+ and Co2+ transporter CorA
MMTFHVLGRPAVDCLDIAQCPMLTHEAVWIDLLEPTKEEEKTVEAATTPVICRAKRTFWLDTTLGLINIEQNGIIKIFSVAAVVLLPPTLVARVYGMNFEIMPELKWLFGYPFAVALMAASAIVPYLMFKKKGWL